jgi:hypothetical protein
LALFRNGFEFWLRDGCDFLEARAICARNAERLSIFLPGAVINFAGLPLAFGMALISSPMRAFAASTTSSALFFHLRDMSEENL